MLARGINGNEPKIVIQVEEDNFLVSLEDLERQASGILARDAADDAKTLGVYGRGHIMLQGCLACGRERQFEARKILADVSDRSHPTNAFPIAAEVGPSIGHSRSGPGGFHIFRSE